VATTPQSGNRSSPGVTIGLREIYDQVVGVVAQLTHLSMLVTALESRHTATTNTTSDLETRVRHLEARPVVTPAAMWTALGVLLTAAGVIVTLVFGILN